MKKSLAILVVMLIAVGLASIQFACKKDDNSGGPGGGSSDLYPVTATVLGPSGSPQGGATLSLQNPPTNVTGTFSTVTDSSGKGTIQSPAGQQTLLARLGVFEATINVNVLASASGTSAPPMTLTQHTTLGKTLVIYADCENIEDVLRDSAIAYTQFDATTVDSMRIRAAADSTALLNWLKQYHVVFSDCNCGDEKNFPLLARVYGQYVTQGGNIYGGHYNYMNLQNIFPQYYKTGVHSSGDSLKIVNQTLSVALGYTVIQFSGISSYELFSDIPTSNVTVYGVILNSTPTTGSPEGIPVIIENRIGSGKYLWTDYHNQDLLNIYTDPSHRLVRIVRYFLYYF